MKHKQKKKAGRPRNTLPEAVLGAAWLYSPSAISQNRNAGGKTESAFASVN